MKNQKYILNSKCEFTEIEEDAVLVDENYTNVYILKKQEKLIVSYFSTPKSIVEAEYYFQSFFEDFNHDEFQAYFKQLIDEKIIVEHV